MTAWISTCKSEILAWSLGVEVIDTTVKSNPTFQIPMRPPRVTMLRPDTTTALRGPAAQWTDTHTAETVPSMVGPAID